IDLYSGIESVAQSLGDLVELRLTLALRGPRRGAGRRLGEPRRGLRSAYGEVLVDDLRRETLHGGFVASAEHRSGVAGAEHSSSDFRLHRLGEPQEPDRVGDLRA